MTVGCRGWMLVLFAPCFISGCWLSHEAATATDGAVPRPDAGVADGGGLPDADSSGCAAVSVHDRRVVEWPSISGCGDEVETRVVARAGGFDILAREGDSPCGRSPLTAVRRATAVVGEYPLTLGDDRVVLEADGRALAAAASGDTLFVASGLRWATFGGAYEERGGGRLADTPMSVPGCPMRLSTSDAAAWAGGWFVAFDYLECDVEGSQYGFYSERGGPLTMLETSWPGIEDVVSRGGGVAFLAQARRAVEPTALTTFENAMAMPVVHDVGASGARAALAPWPFGAASDVAVVFADREPGGDPVVQLVVVSESGSERLRGRAAVPNPYELRGYGVASIDAAAADFGLVVAMAYGWEGSRIDAAYSVVTFGPDGTLLGGALIEAGLGVTNLGVAVGASGPHAVVSVLPGETGVHQAILMGCPF